VLDGDAGDSSGAATCCAPDVEDMRVVQGMVTCLVLALLACQLPAWHRPGRVGDDRPLERYAGHAGQLTHRE